MDYSRVSEIVTFPAGSGNGAMACIDVPIVNDDLIEGTEYYIVKPLLKVLSTVVDLGDARFYISDDEGAHYI
jgi:hypothetical protein